MDRSIETAFIQYCVGKKGITQQSAKVYINQINLYVKRTNKDLDTTKHINVIEYLSDLRLVLKLSQNTRRLARTAFVKFYEWYAARAGMQNPAVELEQIKQFSNVPKYLDPDRIEQILFNLYRRNNDWGKMACGVISLIASTGIRIHEFEKLKVGDVKEIYDKKTGRVYFTLLVNSSKTNSARVIPFNLLIEGNLTEYFSRYWLWIKAEKHQKNNQPLFFRLENKYNKLATDQSVALKRWTVRRMLDVASDERVSVNQLRHFFATFSILAGMSVHTLQHLMGHVDLNTTMNYVHVAEIERGDALEHSPTKGIRSDPSVWGYTRLLIQIAKQMNAID